MSAKKYRKKPVEIEAMRLTKVNAHEVAAWCGGKHAEAQIPAPGRGLDPGIVISTLEGEMFAAYGDYVIKGVKSEFYPCKPDIFTATYEEVQP